MPLTVMTQKRNKRLAMNNRLVNFIREKNIDSFQKLRFLLFLYQHPKLTGTSRQFAKRLYLGDVSLLEKIIDDLRAAGLVNCIENRWILHDEPKIRRHLQHLTKAFDDPLARQEILEQVQNDKGSGP
jgi:hypothetical protein